MDQRPRVGRPRPSQSVRDVVGRRLSRLSEATNDLLTVAGTCRPRVRPVHRRRSGRHSPRTRWLSCSTRPRDPGCYAKCPNVRATLAFTHALVRQTLLEEISGPRRAHLHWQIGQALTASGNAAHGVIAYHLCEGVPAGDPRIAAEAAVGAAEEASTIGASDEANDLALGPWSSRMRVHSTHPRLRCRAILVIGNCLALNPVGDLAPRSLLSEAGWLAVEHGWPHLAARAARTYGSLTRPGARPRGDRAPRRGARHGRGTTIGAQPWPLSRQATRRRTVIASIMNGPSPKSRPRPPRSSAATHWVECWSPRTDIWCTSATPTPTTERSRVTYAWRSTRSEGSGLSRRSWGRSAHLCDTGTATTSTPPLPSSPSSLLAPA